MSDDLLQRATRALRDQEPGGEPEAAPGKLLILRTIEANQRASARRMAVLMPLAALLVTSTAIAAATGLLPTAWREVKRLAGVTAAEPAPSAPSADSSSPAPSLGPARHPAAKARAPEAKAEVPEAGPSADSLLQPEVQAAAPGQAQETAPEQPRATARSAPRATAAQVAVAPKPSVRPAAKAEDKEPLIAAKVSPPSQEAALREPPAAAPIPVADGLDLFRDAQRLQFRQGDWAAALTVWQRYLQAFPHGALAPEARWNRAVCLLRLHRDAEARRALQPFADGSEGGYRQAEAQALLKALRDNDQLQ